MGENYSTGKRIGRNMRQTGKYPRLVILILLKLRLHFNLNANHFLTIPVLSDVTLWEYFLSMRHCTALKITLYYQTSIHSLYIIFVRFKFLFNYLSFYLKLFYNLFFDNGLPSCNVSQILLNHSTLCVFLTVSFCQ